MIRYLSLEQVLGIAEDLGDLKVRDLGLLDSALHRPQSQFGGVEAYPTLERKAAALLQSLVKNHALFDGNKRLAWTVTIVFLMWNGHTSGLTQDGAFALVMTIADPAGMNDGEDISIDTIGAWLHLTPLDA